MAFISTSNAADWFCPGAVRKEFLEIWRELFGSYRPERHYMRGPGSIREWELHHGIERDTERKPLTDNSSAALPDTVD